MAMKVQIFPLPLIENKICGYVGTDRQSGLRNQCCKKRGGLNPSTRTD